MPKKPQIGDPDFDPTSYERQWPTLPLSMLLIEYRGDGDPAFGGSADDRVVLDDGSVEARPRASGQKCAVYQTVAQAHAAARAIPNRRPNSILGVAPTWR